MDNQTYQKWGGNTRDLQQLLINWSSIILFTRDSFYITYLFSSRDLKFPLFQND